MITVTDIGVGAISNAAAGGFLLDFVKFAVTDSTTAVPSALSTALVGVPSYEGQISNIEVLTGSSVKLTLEIPRGIPHSGSLTISEIGVYLATGELFAHGILPTPYTKSAQYGFTTYVIVTAARLGDVINVSVPNVVSLASVASVRSLQAPFTSAQNAVVVSDALTNDDNSTSASIALKFGAGSINWGFLGYNRVFNDVGATVLSTSQFRLDISKVGGFWLDDNEIVLINITTGDGFGESRRVLYNTLNSEFTVLEKPFSALTPTSRLAIWRENSRALPKRLPNIPEYMMLGVGRNTFAQTAIASNSNALVPHRIDYTSDATGLFALPVLSAQTMQSTSNFMVFVAGSQLDPASYTVSAAGILITGIAVGVAVSVLALEIVQSTGNTAVMNDAQYITDGVTSSFNLPVIPDTSNQVLAFVNQQLVPQTDYVITGAGVQFTVPPTAGTLDFIVISTFIELAATSTTVQATQVATAGYTSIVVAAPELSKKNTIVMFDGKLVDKTLYYVQPNTVMFYNQVPVGTSVHVTTLVSSTASLAHTSPTGENTGPVWADPAGQENLPNMITPTGVSYAIVANQRSYAVPSVVDKSRIIAFVGTQLVDPSDFSYKNGVFSFVRTVPPVGLTLDITCFTETTAIDSGCSANCWSYRTVVAPGPVVFNLPNTVNSVWDTMLFIDGVYVSKAQYSIAGQQLSVNTVQSNVPVVATLWAFRVVAAPGQRTEIAVEPKASIPHGDNVLENPVTSADDLLWVVGSTTTDAKYSDAFGTTSGYARASHHVSNSAFALTVRATGEQLVEEIPNESLPTSQYAVVSVAGQPSNSGRTGFLFSVFSGAPRTRLMLRQEADARYLRVGPLGKVNLSDLDQAVQTRLGASRFAYATPA